MNAISERIQTRIESLPDGWRMKRLGDICRQDRSIVEPLSEEATQRPYLGLEDVESETGRILRSPGNGQAVEGVSTTFAFDDRHVLYGKLRPYLNKVALPNYKGRCTTELIPLLPTDATCRDFLAWVLRRRETVTAAMKEKTGSRMPRADMDEIMRLAVPVPPLAEQRRIAALLNQQMETVERARRAAETQNDVVEAVAPICLCEAWNEAEAVAGKLTRLGDLASSKDAFADGPFGSNLKTEHYTSQGARVVRLQNIGCRLFLNGDHAFISLEHSARLQRHHVREGDIVFAALGDGTRPAGRSCLIPAGFGTGLVKADCFRLRLPQDRVHREFLVDILNAPQSLGAVADATRGATRPRVNLQHLRSLRIPLPPITDQRRITAKLSEKLRTIESGAHAIREEIQAIERLPAAFLRRAFNGGCGDAH